MNHVKLSLFFNQSPLKQKLDEGFISPFSEYMFLC